MLMMFLLVLCCFATATLGIILLLEVYYNDIKLPIPLYIKLPVFIILLSFIITKILMA